MVHQAAGIETHSIVFFLRDALEDVLKHSRRQTSLHNRQDCGETMKMLSNNFSIAGVGCQFMKQRLCD